MTSSAIVTYPQPMNAPSPTRARELSSTLPQKARATRTSSKARQAKHRLHFVPQDLSAADLLMIQHGQFECGPGVRPIVPRCMTALPQNLTELLESLLPHGY
jgi:hypothetical protein